MKSSKNKVHSKNILPTPPPLVPTPNSNSGLILTLVKKSTISSKLWHSASSQRFWGVFFVQCCFIFHVKNGLLAVFSRPRLYLQYILSQRFCGRDWVCVVLKISFQVLCFPVASAGFLSIHFSRLPCSLNLGKVPGLAFLALALPQHHREFVPLDDRSFPALPPAFVAILLPSHTRTQLPFLDWQLQGSTAHALLTSPSLGAARMPLPNMLWDHSLPFPTQVFTPRGTGTYLSHLYLFHWLLQSTLHLSI